MVRLPFNWAGSSNHLEPRKSSSGRYRRAPQQQPVSFKNYYHVLGIPRHANKTQIDAAYAKHLDRYGPHVEGADIGHELQMKMLREINEAYRALINPTKRKAHDNILTKYLGPVDPEDLREHLTDRQQKSDDNSK